MYNIDNDSAAKKRLKEMIGKVSIPLIDIEGTQLLGFSSKAIRDAVESKR